jgi:hypothetical protein
MYVIRMRYVTNVYRVIAERPEGRRLLERPRHLGQINVKLNLMALHCEDVHPAHLTSSTPQ